MDQLEKAEADVVIQQKRWQKASVLITLFGFACLALFFGFQYINTPPTSVEYPLSFTVAPGENIRSVASELASIKAIRSEDFLYLVLVTQFDPTAIKASSYVLERPLTTYELATRLVEGDFDTDLIRFTHIEGQSVSKLAEAAEEQVPGIDKAAFIAAALPLEGKLFPETYFVRNDFTAEELVTLLHRSFNEAIAPYESEIAASPYELDEIIILASIIEREANTPESMALVASVFENRLAIGMPLQADASIEYILDKPLNELTAEDLDIDSPYNTYVNPGLPPTPIGNPGLVAIEAMLYPAESNYFYYITDDTGTFHFAETYDEHLRNIERYLR